MSLRKAKKRVAPAGADGDRRADVRGVLRLLLLTFRLNPRWSWSVLVTMSALGMMPAAQIFAVRGVFNRLAELLRSPDPAQMSQVVGWLAVFVGILGAFNLLFGLAPVLQAGYRESTVQVLGSAAYDALGQIHPLSYEQPSFHDKLSRIRSALDRTVAPWADSFVWFVQSLVMVVVTAMVFAKVHWAVLVLAIVGGVLQLAAESATQSRQYLLFVGQTPLHRKESYFAELLGTRDSLRELVLFGARDRFHARWRGLVGELWQQQWQLAVRSGLLSFLARLALVAQSIGSMLMLLHLYTEGRIDIGLLVGVFTSLLGFQQAIGMLVVGSVGWLGQGMYNADLGALLLGSADRAGRAAAAAPAPTAEPALAAEPAPRASAPRAREVNATGESPVRAGCPGLEIHLENVSFSYPGSARPTVRDVTLHVRPGEKIAILGENGSGKTTLANLLLGLYPATEGCVRFDGADARDVVFPLGARSAVFQSFVRYWLTIRQNIAFGFLPRLDDDAAVVAAAEVAIFHLAGGLMRRLNTPLGREFGGLELSGGLWQRLSVARGMVAPARFFLFDEVTSKLDPKAESDLLGLLRGAVASATVVLISHRLPLIRLADRIIVMKDGCIEEQGTHAELVARGGAYATLYEAQARWYRTAMDQPATAAVTPEPRRLPSKVGNAHEG